MLWGRGRNLPVQIPRSIHAARCSCWVWVSRRRVSIPSGSIPVLLREDGTGAFWWANSCSISVRRTHEMFSVFSLGFGRVWGAKSCANFLDVTLAWDVVFLQIFALQNTCKFSASNRANSVHTCRLVRAFKGLLMVQSLYMCVHVIALMSGP
ncbi:hypothetical protein BRADI_3g06911v3 [Brachypodium distachyon]|uniref:Uncharacterized protein n=1 Tax=Brachypodium distachyon TaxID=15368 RepID=A0A0Q3F344_BRADI|nr:hypothetical protein BRADI_3g06911v3 [Brachypodium distachyon]KQJ93822.1 hypothetical protein BRADI_3g06911v3 [Brachypodium distachyon]